ncbi:RING/U-box superfamily protein [Forsythia ovata]|uniref:RING/U-box superfamily protein n=1 Tax=Forsythia ovata TaxID=205694 RepID=A0ABD1VEY9_9LAMI
MSVADEIFGQQLVNGLQGLSIQDQCQEKGTCTAAPEKINQVVCKTNNINYTTHHGLCAICLNKIVLEETALVKGCEHAYCVTCILRWASYKKEPTCPQCKNPFKFLNIHRSLDGSIHDYMFEESVCLLLRASCSSSLRIGNRRWGDNGYVRAGRQEARPISRPNFQDSGAGPSRQTNNKEAAAKETVGRRAKRALKREAADKAAAANHQQH